MLDLTAILSVFGLWNGTLINRITGFFRIRDPKNPAILKIRVPFLSFYEIYDDGIAVETGVAGGGGTKAHSKCIAALPPRSTY